MNVGYARVSTIGQTLESQLEELGKGGRSKIYSETASGARICRPQLQSLLKALDPGDVVVVTRLDRLARSTIDLLTTIKQIADNGCLFKSMADPWCDTTTPGGRLMLTVLSGLAEFERELIKARTSEGRERAKRHSNGSKTQTKSPSDRRGSRTKGRRRISKIPGSFLWCEPQHLAPTDEP